MVIQDDESAATAPVDCPPETSVDCPPEAPADCPPETSVDNPPEAPVGFPPVEASVECPSADAVDCPPQAPVGCPPINASVTEWLAHSREDCPNGHRYPPPQNEATASVSDEDDQDSKEPTTACLPFQTNFILLSYSGKASTAFLKRLVFRYLLRILAIIAFLMKRKHI
ncbi:hypothetical protein CEP54_014622 [Fusarium duplospermum]|uniref:Uncharacterized protein n=1 Tax=Fusarium duplospermum TaxID=1325734 RepID=A0A428NV25_9HYPO|nr:hypothetical protein CEP54_014622 [Fusarium duplospermum]